MQVRGSTFAACAAFFMGACSPTAPTQILLQVPPAPPDAGGPIVPVRDAGLPLPADAGRPAGQDDGTACSVHAQCASEYCLSPEIFPDGYCSMPGCRRDDQCDRPNGRCVLIPGLRFCADFCSAADPCRPGYTCATVEGGGDVCLPDLGPTGRPDGNACTSSAQCQGGTCLTGADWPGGYCTQLNCDEVGCGDPGSVCAPEVEEVPGGRSWCAKLCQTFDDCREEYACIGSDPGICWPDRAERPNLSSPASWPPGMSCGLAAQNGSVEIEYDVPPGATSYMITALTRDGRYLSPQAILRPDGQQIDFTSDTNSFQSLTAQLHGFVSPVVVPAVSQLSPQLASGPHVYRLATRSQDVCWYLLPETTAGTTIRFNFYFVGTQSLRASTALQHRDFLGMVDELERNFSQIGIALGPLTFFDVSPADAQRFQVVRSEDEFFELMRRSGRPSPEGQLSVNLFLVLGFAFDDGGPLGIASGLPGPAALHGTGASGVAASVEYLGLEGKLPDGTPINGNALTGAIVAHEVGHYLGLRHTSEVGGGYDFVLDTPECPGALFPDNCPDLGNLMFPLAFPGNDSLTEGQAFQVRASPLTRN